MKNDIPALQYHLRPATTAHAQGIARVQIDTWHSTYRGIVPDDFLTSMSYPQNTERWSRGLKAAEENPRRVTLVAETDDGNVIGFVSGGPEREGVDNYDGELYALYLLPEHQGKGIGAALMRGFMEEIQQRGFQSMLVWVLTANPTLSFYQHLGGTEVRRKIIEIGGAELEETGYGWKL